jgi:hypothetical protein
MEKQGYRPATARRAVEALRSLSRRVNLFDTDAVRGFLAKAKVSDGRKERLSNDLARFYRFRDIPFDKPRYRNVEKLPFVPLEPEVEQLVSGMGQKTGTFLQLLRETWNGTYISACASLSRTFISYCFSVVTGRSQTNTAPFSCRMHSEYWIKHIYAGYSQHISGPLEYEEFV